MNYSPPPILFSAHLETIFPALFRKVQLSPYQRERIPTPDNDFLDLDWLRQGSSTLVIISHGLEGNSDRAYVKGMARACRALGYDVLAWNYRGCSGEMNRQLRFYHSGATDDLHTVIVHARKCGYQTLHLVGFSLGGNLTLKYLGEDPTHAEGIGKAVVFSVPMDLDTSCTKISKPGNWMYSRRFVISLKRKVKEKAALRPDLDTSGLNKVKTLREFDDHFTGPVHGFRNAADYYAQCSSVKFVTHIARPTLIINAQNDPFLSPECFPEDLLKSHSFVRLAMPRYGGHVGFTSFGTNGLYWSEQQAAAFLSHD